MKRREFIRKSFGAGVAAGGLLSVHSFASVFGAENNSLGPFDMVAIKGGQPEEMFIKAIGELGGMKHFVKPGQSVVVKPNIGWDAPPERASNTNPNLIGEIVKQCFGAGAKKVSVFDHTCDEWTKCYRKSGIERAVKDAGGEMVTGKSEKMYREVKIPKGKVLKSAKVHELVLDSDVMINVPVLKCHGGAVLSLSMKNLMGVVWDRRFWHSNDLHQCIADFATFRNPDLIVIDAYNVLKRNGPKGVSVDDVAQMKHQILATDMVAADTAAAKVFGTDINQVKHITLAESYMVGTTKLETLNIKRISL